MRTVLDWFRKEHIAGSGYPPDDRKRTVLLLKIGMTHHGMGPMAWDGGALKTRPLPRLRRPFSHPRSIQVGEVQELAATLGRAFSGRAVHVGFACSLRGVS